MASPHPPSPPGRCASAPQGERGETSPRPLRVSAGPSPTRGGEPQIWVRARRAASPSPLVALTRSGRGGRGGEDRLLRRLLHIYVSALGLTVLWPFLALIALLIRLESPGAPVFRQVRVGRGGRPFTVYKFRTMRKDAPPGELRVRDFGSYVFTPPGGDQRRTRIGTVLRVTSMDEVLQLLNVLRGEMTLVGPRPEIPEIVAQYPPHYHARHDVLPGITGLAQINGRSDLTYSEIIAYDLDYVRRRSPALDLHILLRTPLVVLRKEGAR